MADEGSTKLHLGADEVASCIQLMRVLSAEVSGSAIHDLVSGTRSGGWKVPSSSGSSESTRCGSSTARLGPFELADPAWAGAANHCSRGTTFGRSGSPS